MTLEAFRQLKLPDKVCLVIATGTYLGQRWRLREQLHLYHLPDAAAGFFVELGYEHRLDTIVVVRSFTDVAALDAYTSQVRLPQLL